MKTVEEKFKYNSQKYAANPSDSFSAGYCGGVKHYKKYAKISPTRRKEHKEYIDEMKIVALRGHKYGKGFMCAVRDCANERKQNKR